MRDSSLRIQMVERQSNGAVLSHEPRENGFCSSHAGCSPGTVSSLCGSISRRVQSSQVFQLGSVSGDVICSIDLPRKSAGHRSLLAESWSPALPPGFRDSVARSTLARANEKRDWRIYADLAQILIRRARALYAQEELPVELTETVYAFDSTTVDVNS